MSNVAHSEESLAKRFQDMDKYHTGYHRYPGAADTFLKKLAEKNILDQLIERSIYKVVFSESPNTGLGRIGENLIIFINENSPKQDQARQLARGLAKSFHFCLTQAVPVDYTIKCVGKSFESRKALNEILNDFYSAFADIWVTLQDVPRLLNELYNADWKKHGELINKKRGRKE